MCSGTGAQVLALAQHFAGRVLSPPWALLLDTVLNSRLHVELRPREQPTAGQVRELGFCPRAFVLLFSAITDALSSQIR